MSVTVEQIYQEVVEELDGDSSFGINRFLRLLNRGMEDIAMGHFPEYPDIPEITVPLLETSYTKAITSLTWGVTMPTDYMKKLVYCYSHDREAKVDILASFDQLAAKDPGMDDTGSIYWCAVVGTSLCYVNRADDTLLLRYYKKPTTLKAGDTVSELPSGLEVDLLKNYVLMKLPTIYRKKLSFDAETEFRKALYKLSRLYNVYSPEEKPIRDVIYGYYE